MQFDHQTRWVQQPCARCDFNTLHSVVQLELARCDEADLLSHFVTKSVRPPVQGPARNPRALRQLAVREALRFSEGKQPPDLAAPVVVVGHP